MIGSVIKWSVLILLAGWIIGQFTFFPLAFQFLIVMVFILIYVPYRIVKGIMKKA